MKIGITLNLSVNFWSNGLNQNVKFLYDTLKRLGHEVYYVTNHKPIEKFKFNHKYMLWSDVLKDSSESFDVFIAAGFIVEHREFALLKSRNPNTKIILLQLGNVLMFEMRDIIQPPSGDGFRFNPVETGELLDAIWISTHHEFGSEYLKVAYGNDNVRVAPYIWDPYFIQSKIEDLKLNGKSPFFNPDLVNRVQIFESNTLVNKNFLVPFCIAHKARDMFPGSIDGINVFCTQKQRNTDYFKSFMSKFSSVREKDFTFFNNRWCTLDALSKFGGVIVSHQYDNDLNYAHFEALYMGVPLVHNSKTLMDEGYYYPDFNIDMGAKQLQNAILNHKDIHDEYMQRGREFVAKYSPHNKDTLHQYQLLLEN